ncbi:MAG: hypothetical protein ACRDIC_19000, partial [bacterium]
IHPKPRLGGFTKVIYWGPHRQKPSLGEDPARAEGRSLRSQPRRVGFGRPYQARPWYDRWLL